MKLAFTKKAINQEKSDCLIIGAYKNKTFTPVGKIADKASNQLLSKLLKSGDFEANLGQTFLISHPAGLAATRILLIGLGEEDKLDSIGFAKAVKSAFLAIRNLSCNKVTCYLTEVKIKNVEAHQLLTINALYAQESIYSFDTYKSEKKKSTITDIDFYLEKPSSKDKETLTQAQAINNALVLAKNVGNEPGNVCTPTYLATQAKALSKDYKKMSFDVLDEAEMKKLGMGALLAVAQGSAQPPKLIILNYQGAKKTEKPYVFVGKGITFDSGGISIKPSQSMEEMKFDMMGAATVLGVLSAVAELDLPINVVGLIPSAENMPDGGATRPGDIVKTMSGQTVEIVNTDAEGRLILCEALTYAEKFDPKLVIDIATLTGSIVVSLGCEINGVFSSDDTLAQELVEVGREIADRAWHMPIPSDYQDMLKSAYADMSNCGPRWAGAITAACFLARFTKKYRWAHIDNAGTAWKIEGNIGATGRPIPLLVNFLLKQ